MMALSVARRLQSLARHPESLVRHPELVSGSYCIAAVDGKIKMLKQVQHDPVFCGELVL
jgi:hypothetical protein